MTDTTPTLPGLVIEKRNWKFGRDLAPRRWWHGGIPAEPPTITRNGPKTGADTPVGGSR